MSRPPWGLVARPVAPEVLPVPVDLVAAKIECDRDSVLVRPRGSSRKNHRAFVLELDEDALSRHENAVDGRHRDSTGKDLAHISKELPSLGLPPVLAAPNSLGEMEDEVIRNDFEKAVPLAVREPALETLERSSSAKFDCLRRFHSERQRLPRFLGPKRTLPINSLALPFSSLE